MKTIQSTLLVAGLLLRAVVAHADVVSFPDANLDAAVRDALGIPAGDITTDDLLTLTEFNAEGRGILDTTGLQAAGNVTNLVFNDNPVTNYSGISGLTNLVRLRFDRASISNLTFVASLSRLELLEIYGNQIQDLSPLAALTGLTSLQLDWNPVTHHAPLAALTNLLSLSLAGNGISNLDFVSSLPALRHLGLYVNQVKDLSPLAGRTDLLSLGLGWNGVTNPAVLATLTGLEELQLNGNPLTNVAYLAGLTNLAGLDLAYTELADLSPVTNLTGLAWVNVGENQLTNLPDLSPLTHVHTFMMAGNPVTDLSPVTNLAALGNLHVQRCAFTSLAPLADCPQLERLLLSGNPQLNNLAELGDLPALRWLELQSMQITNLSFLTNVTALEEADLFDNSVLDLSPLPALPNLQALSLGQNRLTDITPLLDCPALTYVNVMANYLDTNPPSAAWNVITNLQDRGVEVEYAAQNPPPVPIEFLVQPVTRSAFVGDPLHFEVSVTGGSPGIQGYQWEKDGMDLMEIGRVNGTDSQYLSIESVEAGDAGFYRVRVWDDWPAVYSATAQLLVITNVAFADTNLEQAVRDELGIPDAPLTPGDLASLDSLDASYRGITSLAGLEAAANLQSLNLSGNPGLAAFAPLTYLAALDNLAVNDAGLDHLNWVGDLRSLTSLQVNANFLTDLTPLRALVNLASFSVTENQLTDIGPLLDLAALTGEVNLSGNRLDTNATSSAWHVITNLQARGVTVNYEPQNAAPNPPVIAQQPADVLALVGETVQFSVAATGSGSGLSYRWQREGINLADTPHLSGTDSDTLTIDTAQPNDSAGYRVRVWDENGVTYSREASLRLITNVAFADPQLEQAVRDSLGIPTAPLTPADMANLFWLEARNYGITNLAGIESALYLDGVTLSENAGITDFTPLTQLPRLRVLDLNACAVSDIAFVASLPLLVELHLWSGTITDISPLLAQPQLRMLNLAYHASITNFAALNSLTNLEWLRLEGTGLDDLAFVSFMPSLIEFSFESCAVQDLSPLSNATNLVWLDLAHNQISDASPLAACINLEFLSAGGNQLANLDFAAGFNQLWFLAVNNNALTNIAGISGLPNLLTLDLGWNPLTDLSPVATLLGLSELHVWNLGLSNNLTFLTPLTNLQFLDAGLNAITTLPPELSGLRRLNLESNPLTDLGFVSGMTNLTELGINGCALADLSPLTGRTNLHNLALAANGISNLSALATLPYLEWITLWDNHVQNIDALAGLTNLNYVDLRHNWLNTNAGAAAMTVIATLQGDGVTVEWDPQDVAPTPITLSQPAWLGAAQFRFTISSEPGAVLQVWSSTNLTSWTSAGWVTNLSGTMTFTNDAAPPVRQFYRAQQQ